EFMTAVCQEYRDKKALDIFIEKRYRLKRYLLFLTVFLLLLYGGDFISACGTPYGYYAAAMVYVIFVGMFYVNMYVLVPTFLFRSKYLGYAIFLILLAVFGVGVLSYLKENYLESHLHQNYIE